MRMSNFQFLASHDPLLAQVGVLAERYCYEDPVTSLTKTRQLAEFITDHVAAQVGLYQRGDDNQASRLRALEYQGFLPAATARHFHSIRKAGNDAVHRHQGTVSDALHYLKLAHAVSIWFHRTFSAKQGRVAPFAAPPNRQKQEEEAHAQLAKLQEELAQARAARKAAEVLTEEERTKRLEAEAHAQEALAEAEAAFSLAQEVEASYQQRLETLQAVQAERGAERLLTIAQKAEAASEEIKLDEAATRRVIDEQLREAGWEADTENLRYSQGMRPQKNRNLAIAEWPTESGPVDYVLFIGLTPVATVEAKRESVDVAGVLDQSARYSKGYQIKGEESLPAGSPWGDFRLPFLFATNSRPYLKQIETKSGIWFRDARRPTNLGRALQGWYTPEGLEQLLAQDVAEADTTLQEQPIDLPGLRPYQKTAIEKVEVAIIAGRQTALLAMATGTGKTRTALALLYRLIKFKRFRRMLFLVDRTALGEQALDAFREVKLEGTLALADTYEVKALGDIEVESDTRVHVATVQSLLKRIWYPDDETDTPAVDQYDGIIIDECHRGYVLDRELSENELGFRDQNEYLSKYRRVVEYFDAVRIGLTATPALHTVEIFGHPVFSYSYRRAVIEGYLVDHLPPIQVKTQLAEDGIHWKVGEEVQVYDPQSGTVDLTTTPDEIDIDIAQFNRLVQTKNFNRAVIEHLVTEIDPELPGKTLVFCVTDSHADLVVQLFKRAFQAKYGSVRNDAVAKITGAADRPGALIRHFRNEAMPNVAVTVDLLTTGVDVTSIVNLVFLRRVKSRILYEQMLGRATRLHKDLYGPGYDKEYFRIFDAVRLYEDLQDYTDMKPVVQRANSSFQQLADELAQATSDQHVADILDQLLAKLQRKRGDLEAQADQVEHATGMRPSDLLDHVRAEGHQAVRDLFARNPNLAAFLDRIRREQGQGQFISHHPDAVVAVVTGYGDKERPEDYLEGFGAWVASHMNEIPALVAVTQRPRALTRAALKDLALELDAAGFNELTLRTAWREARNQDIAATIIGFIRSQALGSPLVPYEERVDRALRRILQGRSWTQPQRQWLGRIARQIKHNTIVDVEALNDQPFKRDGGFRRIDRVFDGRLRDVIGDFQEAIWTDVG